MITGVVRNREPILELEVCGPAQQYQQIEVLIDTGYNGHLTLPNQIISSLQLPFAGYRRGMLADGSVIQLELFMASVLWHGQQKDVLILQSEGIPLIGMALLEGNRMTIDVVDSGSVTVEELPSSP